MTFRVGMKVVCVDGDMRVNWAGWHPPTKWAVYTVREVRRSLDRITYGDTSLLLDEITNPLGPHGRECGFLGRRFRPVQERKTDISIFTAMLNPSQVTVDAG